MGWPPGGAAGSGLAATGGSGLGLLPDKERVKTGILLRHPIPICLLPLGHPLCPRSSQRTSGLTPDRNCWESELHSALGQPWGLIWTHRGPDTRKVCFAGEEKGSDRVRQRPQDGLSCWKKGAEVQGRGGGLGSLSVRCALAGKRVSLPKYTVHTKPQNIT